MTAYGRLFVFDVWNFAWRKARPIALGLDWNSSLPHSVHLGTVHCTGTSHPHVVDIFHRSMGLRSSGIAHYSRRRGMRKFAWNRRTFGAPMMCNGKWGYRLASERCSRICIAYEFSVVNRSQDSGLTMRKRDTFLNLLDIGPSFWWDMEFRMEI